MANGGKVIIKIDGDISGAKKSFDDISSRAKKTSSTIVNEMGTASTKSSNSTASISKSARQDFDKVGKSSKDASDKIKKNMNNAEKTSIDSIKNIESFAVKSFGAITAGLGIMEIAGFADEYDRASNHIQAVTGATADELANYNKVMEDVYKNNLGDSIEDVASALSNVITQTGASGDELQKLTEYAFALSDTYNMDVNESIRATNGLMEQFGINSETAFNLVAQGAQKGLNQNQDLGDQLSEYTTYFSDMGFSADEMFNMLANGADEGVYQIDYLNDAIKEFSIRTKDGSKSTEEAFGIIGLNADDMSAKFATGGEMARQAFDETTKALFSLEDPLLRNQAGVDLFGTKWEDLGEDAIRALTSTQGSINSTKGAMDDLVAIKYSSIGEGFVGIGRTLMVDLIQPLTEDLTPALEQLTLYLRENLPAIVETLKAIFENWLPIVVALATAFIAWKTAMTISAVIDTLTNSTKLLTIAQKALAVVMNANWIAILITAIISLVAYFVTLYNTNEEFRVKVTEVWETIKNFFKGAIDAIIGTIKGWVDSLTKSWETIMTKGKEFANGMKTLFTKTIPSVFNKLSDFMKNVFSTDWSERFGFFGDILNAYLANVKNIIDAVKRVFGGLTEFISGVFTGNWERAWNGIKDIFGGIFDGFVSIAKTPLNGVIGLINGMIGAINSAIGKINSISIDIPEWVPVFGGNTYSPDFRTLSKVPYLAKGAVLKPNKPFMAMVGDQKHGTNIEAPLETIKQALREVIMFNNLSLSSGMGNNSSVTNNSPVFNINVATTSSTESTLGIKQITRQLGQELHKEIRSRGLIYG